MRAPVASAAGVGGLELDDRLVQPTQGLVLGAEMVLAPAELTPRQAEADAVVLEPDTGDRPRLAALGRLPGSARPSRAWGPGMVWGNGRRSGSRAKP